MVSTVIHGFASLKRRESHNYQSSEAHHRNTVVRILFAFHTADGMLKHELFQNITFLFGGNLGETRRLSI